MDWHGRAIKAFKLKLLDLLVQKSPLFANSQSKSCRVGTHSPTKTEQLIKYKENFDNNAKHALRAERRSLQDITSQEDGFGKVYKHIWTDGKAQCEIKVSTLGCLCPLIYPRDTHKHLWTNAKTQLKVMEREVLN